MRGVLGGRGEPRQSQPDPDTVESRGPALRIVAEEGHGANPAPIPAHHEAPPVLLAGADAGRRATLRAELSTTLPPRTPFSEADVVSEVLERAPASRMVILAGDLDDADAGALMRLLGHRHPRLPVISVQAATPAVAVGHC